MLGKSLLPALRAGPVHPVRARPQNLKCSKRYFELNIAHGDHYEHYVVYLIGLEGGLI